MALGKRARVCRKVKPILGWPCDTFAIDFDADLSNDANSLPELPHTVIIFVPGNPGLVDWYIPFFQKIVGCLGPGFAARGVSNAGHGVSSEVVDVETWEGSKDRSVSIPWTVDGQSLHKVAFMDMVLKELDELRRRHSTQRQIEPPRLIFVTHSVGVHFTQRLFVLRPDVLKRCCLLVSLMPFIRMKAPRSMQAFLNLTASHPQTTIAAFQSFSKILATMPLSWVDQLMMRSMKDDQGRKIAVQVVRQPAFVKNFLSLGFDEIPNVPEVFDVCALRLVGNQCPTVILYAGNDHWAPPSHISDIKLLQSKGVIPDNISISYRPELKHDYVSDPDQIAVVVDFCVKSIQKAVRLPPRSRL